MDEPQKKRLTRKKAEPPAPRQPRVRPRLAVTVLGDPGAELLPLNVLAPPPRASRRLGDA